jgi:hypothetical protein
MQTEGFEVTVAKTAPVEHLDFEVHTLRETIIDATDEII